MPVLGVPSQTNEHTPTKQCVLNLASDHMVAEVVGTHGMYGGRAIQGLILAVEVKILRASIHKELRLDEYRNCVDADKWKPLIMIFCDFYGSRDGKLKHSRLAEVEEEMYRGFTETTGEVEDEQAGEVAEHVAGVQASHE